MGNEVGPSYSINRLSDWVQGERVVSPAFGGGGGNYYCIRDLSWPSQSPSKQFFQTNPSSAWYTGATWGEQHYGTGPIARGIYILAQGLDPYIDSTPANRTWTSPFMPYGVAGIGTDAAAQIWYQALTQHFTSNMTYAFVWSGLEQSAIDLYGRDSAEHQAVNNALAAVNLAAPWRDTDSIYDTEPNNIQSQATILPIGHSHHIANGIIDPDGDTDWYQFTLPAGHTLSIWITSQVPSYENGGSLSSAPGFELRNETGTTLLKDSTNTPYEFRTALPLGPHIHHIDEPDPDPDFLQTRAQYHYQNMGVTAQVVYLKIRQEISDLEGNTYSMDVRDWIRDLTLMGGSPTYLEIAW